MQKLQGWFTLHTRWACFLGNSVQQGLLAFTVFCSCHGKYDFNFAWIIVVLTIGVKMFHIYIPTLEWKNMKLM